MGVLLVTGGVVSLLLPETLHQHLPQTLEDGEKMGIDLGVCCQPPSKHDITEPEEIQSSKKVEILEFTLHDIDYHDRGGNTDSIEESDENKNHVAP